jgi:FkbM family methyltransferase
MDETRRIVDSIFFRGEYRFHSKTAVPRIIDCGAHIGIATLYFKRLYPDCKVTSIEANPENVELLKRNIALNQIDDVEVFWGALSGPDSATENINLYIDPNPVSPWSWGDTIVKDMWGNKTSRASIEVPALLLSQFIDGPVDFLKIDIEGAEAEVIQEAGSNLNSVEQIVVEFHRTSKTPIETLKRIESVLAQAGFTITVETGDWQLIRALRRQ